MKRSSLTALAAAGLLAASVAVVLTQTATAEIPDERIIGGEPASEKYEFIGSLQTEKDGNPDYHKCGTALIAERWVLTAAHCLDDGDGGVIDPALLHVNIGSNNLTKGTEVAVDKVAMHPDFMEGKDHMGDIALLRLAEAPDVPTIKLGAQPKAGTNVRMVGWGQTDIDDPESIPDSLRQLDTKVVGDKSCEFGDEFSITEGDICVDSPELKAGACFGDSGGPLIAEVNGEWVTFGANSRSGGTDCLETDHIYTGADYYTKWIKKTIDA